MEVSQSQNDYEQLVDMSKDFQLRCLQHFPSNVLMTTQVGAMKKGLRKMYQDFGPTGKAPHFKSR